MGLFDGKKAAQKAVKVGGIAASLGALLAGVIPPDGSAVWEVALYTGIISTALSVLKHGLGVQIPGLD